MESLEVNQQKFWKNKKVFLTGHTGFKGSWLSLWLSLLGAQITGYSLAPPTTPSLFELGKVDGLLHSIIADIREKNKLNQALKEAKPEIIIHMAAQPIVRESYKLPVETYDINVMGTINLMEAARQCASIRAVVNVTTDKVYENKERKLGYREDEALGGYDPYSSSKACSEIVSAAYRQSYGLNVATARAGNVIGGGDWAQDRLVPDFVRSILKGNEVLIRNPKAIRPWQHVIEPLSGYLLLAEKLYKNGVKYAEAWNFGPEEKDAKPVRWMIEKLIAKWGEGKYRIDQTKHPHEAHYLKLDCSKARKKLGWHPRWNLEQALGKIVEWTKDYQQGNDLQGRCFEQIEEYMDGKG